MPNAKEKSHSCLVFSSVVPCFALFSYPAAQLACFCHYIILYTYIFYLYFFSDQIHNVLFFIFLDTDGLICQALLVGNFEAAVDLCLKDGRYADAIILANAGGEDLLRETQQWYFARQKNKITTVSRQYRLVTEDNISLMLSCLVTRQKLFL